MSTFAQSSLRCSPEDVGKRFNDVYCPGKGGTGRRWWESTRSLSWEAYTPVWQLEKPSGLWIHQRKPTTRWAELSKNCLFTLCWCRLLNSKALLHVVDFQALWKTKGEHNLDYIHEHWFDDFSGSLQAPHIAGENVTIFLLIAKFARCDFSYPSICLSALTAAEPPFPNTNLPCSHAISAGVHYATKQERRGINLCPKGTKMVCWRAKKSFILRKLPEKSAVLGNIRGDNSM